MKYDGLILIICCSFAQALIADQPAAQLQPAEGDTFKFTEGRSRIVTTTLSENGNTLALEWPAVDSASWDTALLQVNIDASAAAVDPYVEIACEGVSDRQHFRAGETGLRWLNLSFLRESVKTGTHITIRAENVHVRPGGATLRLFANNLDLSRSILVLAPHPDDAEIGAFGVYANRQATVVTVTTGNAGPANYEAVFDDVPAHYQFKGRIRLIDSITVPWVGGIPPARTFNMGYFDARLAEMHDRPDTVVPEMYGPNTDIGMYLKYNLGSLLPKRPRVSKWTNLVEDIERVLRKVNPAVILAPHPQLDSHRDHQFTTVALAEALKRWSKRVMLVLYTNHVDQNRYPYGPAGTLVSLPPPLPRDVLLDRVYSHPLSLELQRLKLFALESMHDLRPSPSRLYQLVIGDDRTRNPEKSGPAATGGVNYLRRAPRSCELFFVYDQDTVKPMLDAFLTEWRTRP